LRPVRPPDRNSSRSAGAGSVAAHVIIFMAVKALLRAGKAPSNSRPRLRHVAASTPSHRPHAPAPHRDAAEWADWVAAPKCRDGPFCRVLRDRQVRVAEIEGHRRTDPQSRFRPICLGAVGA
jgi:hypothetical protein